MPLHVHPLLRAREEMEEFFGLIVPLDSVGVTIRKAQEASGVQVKPVPKVVYSAHGGVFVPS